MSQLSNEEIYIFENFYGKDTSNNKRKNRHTELGIWIFSWWVYKQYVLLFDEKILIEDKFFEKSEKSKFNSV